MAYTLQVGREAMEERLVLVVSSLRELAEKLARYAQGDTNVEGLYRGNVRQSKFRSESLLEGKEGAEFIKTVVEQGKWAKLAQLWLLGVEVDWRLLHRNPDGSWQKRQRVSLPTYPFARLRHWLPESTVVPVASTRGLHPLLDQVDSRRSFFQNQNIIFKKTLWAADPLIKDHRVLGRGILPGVGYLGMAHAALSQLAEPGSFELGRVVLLQPLVVADSTDVLVVVKEAGGHLQFEIQSSSDASAGKPATHATGVCRIRPTPRPDARESVSVQEIKERCKFEIQKADFYPPFKEIGIEYGPYYQTVEHVWGGDQEALGLITLPPHCPDELREYPLHPTMLDGALQVIAGLTINRRPGNELVLPFAIDSVEVVRSLTPRVYAHVRLLEKDRYDVTVMDEAGQVCVKIRDLALRKVKAKDSLAEFFYLPSWQAVPLAVQSVDNAVAAAAETGPARPRQTVLLFEPIDPSGLEDALSNLYAADNLISVRLGAQTIQLAENRWELNTRDSAGLDRWLGQFETFDELCFLSGLQNLETNTDDLAEPDQSQESGVLSLFRLTKSLIRLGYQQQPLRLRLITNEACGVLQDDIVRPFAASLFGLVKSLARENQRWSISSLDVKLREFAGASQPKDFSELTRAIIAEPRHPRGDTVALRDGRRYVRSLTPLQLSPVNSTLFRQGGVYLILGGAGGIGLELGKYLAEKVQANLVLIGRRELSQEQRRQIAMIESSGGSVCYVQADATDLTSMRNAVAQAKARFGAIHGVIHSALVLKDKTIEAMTEAEFRAALAPKIQGSVNLYRAVAGEALDFFLFFSSAQSFSGNAGQSNYVAGCTFKDAFADFLRQVVPFAVKTINWGYWGEVGVVASAEYNRRLASQGVGSINVAEGMEAVRRVLSHPVNQVMPLKVDRHVLEALDVDLQHLVTLHPNQNPSVFKGALQEIVEPAHDVEELRRSKAAFREVAALGQELILAALQQMGVFRNAGEQYERDSARAIADCATLLPPV